MDARKSSLEFVKMTGAGNDFILIDNRKGSLSHDWPAVAPEICDRRFGIGADGILVLEPSQRADFRMNYFNADGSYGGMCGNGGRCAAHFFMSRTGEHAASFEALDNIYRATQIGTEVSLSMIDPPELRLHQSVELSGQMLPLHFVDTGSPHAVLFIDSQADTIVRSIDRDGINPLGREIRKHPHFQPGGTNVDFIRVEPDGSVSMRTYERGVEEETLACGTGAIASAIVASLVDGRPKSPVAIRTRGGSTLYVDFVTDRGSIRSVTLRGPAEIVFTGSYFLPNA